MTPVNTQPFRIAKRGSRIGTKPIRFSFDGKSYEGLEGDTLASALLAERKSVCRERVYTEV